MRRISFITQEVTVAQDSIEAQGLFIKHQYKEIKRNEVVSLNVVHVFWRFFGQNIFNLKRAFSVILSKYF